MNPATGWESRSPPWIRAYPREGACTSRKPVSSFKQSDTAYFKHKPPLTIIPAKADASEATDEVNPGSTT